MPSTLDPKLDGALSWASTKAALVAAFPAPSFPNGTLAPTTDQGLQYWNASAAAWLPVTQTGNLGILASSLYRWKPLGNKAVIFTAVVAVGNTTKTLTANWPGPTGLFKMTLSSGEIVNALLTNGATTCAFFPFPTPPTLGSYGTAYAATLAATINATVANCPPVLGVANAYSVSASIGAAGSAVLVAGFAPDVPRNVVGAWTGASIVTVTGTDYYGAVQTEASASGTTLATKKTFATVTSIVSSASITAATFGTGAVLGLPFRALSGDISSPVLADAADAGTLVLGDITTPATASTGDVRGTYTAAAALDGVKVLAANIHLSADDPSRLRNLGVTPV
jgi:uncharacterized membrane protein (Fun14 family)